MMKSLRFMLLVMLGAMFLLKRNNNITCIVVMQYALSTGMLTRLRMPQVTARFYVLKLLLALKYSHMLLFERRGSSMGMCFELITRRPTMDLSCKKTEWMIS
jgi:hypothetical protein